MKTPQKLLCLFLLLILPQMALATESAPYLTPGQLDLTQFLPPPPTAGSIEQNEEIEKLLQFQRTRTPEKVAAARADMTLSVFRFADVLGPAFNAEKLPRTKAFFDKVAEASTSISNAAKDFWHRPRPYVFSKAIEPCLDKPGNASYPSGHSTFATQTAIILANMVPEKKSMIFARAAAFRLNREIGGVHYPSDVRAGELAGTLIAQALFQSPAFKTDFDAAKQEVRAALQLPQPAVSSGPAASDAASSSLATSKR